MVKTSTKLFLYFCVCCVHVDEDESESSSSSSSSGRKKLMGGRKMRRFLCVRERVMWAKKLFL
jgi:hypothetical protein